MTNGESSSLPLRTDVIAGSVGGWGRGTVLVKLLKSLSIFVRRVVQQVVGTVTVPDSAQSLREAGAGSVEFYSNVYPSEGVCCFVGWYIKSAVQYNANKLLENSTFVVHKSQFLFALMLNSGVKNVKNLLSTTH